MAIPEPRKLHVLVPPRIAKSGTASNAAVAEPNRSNNLKNVIGLKFSIRIRRSQLSFSEVGKRLGCSLFMEWKVAELIYCANDFLVKYYLMSSLLTNFTFVTV